MHSYAGTIRDSALEQEREFLSLVLDCVLRRRGCVLVPVFALGKAQELCALLERCWTRLGLDVPIYFAPGMAERASAFFRVHAQWGSHTTRQESVPMPASAASGTSDQNIHHSTSSTTSSLPSASLSSRPPLQKPATHASVWRPDPRQQNHHGTGFAPAPSVGVLLDAAAGLDGSPFGAAAAEQPCVLFASPGMLQGGLALDVFRAWAPDARNAVRCNFWAWRSVPLRLFCSWGTHNAFHLSVTTTVSALVIATAGYFSGLVH
jgi:hypothetical protein